MKVRAPHPFVANRTTLSPEKKIVIGLDVLEAIDADLLDDSYVYVHCRVRVPAHGFLVRIWRTTFLKDCHSAGQAQLLHALGISFAPAWTLVPEPGTFTFLLVFSALPKSCTLFDLVEEIAQPGGFLVKSIARNKTDVYRVTLE